MTTGGALRPRRTPPYCTRARECEPAIGEDLGVTRALFDLAPADVDRLRTALTGYTVDTVAQALGPIGQAALARGDLRGSARALHAEPDLATLIRLFVLGEEQPADAVTEALAPFGVSDAVAAGVLAGRGDTLRAAVDIRPYGDAATPWWVVSDFGTEHHGAHTLPADHVLGVGAASLTLAQATPRDPVGRALDVGTGCGVQMLHLSQHARQVVGTDISPRAIAMARLTAALSGVAADLRTGSLLDPVAGEQFDLVVANPPFVVSPGWRTGSPRADGFDYRDSGLAGDELCRRLVGGLPSILHVGGTAQLLANWLIPPDGDWQGYLRSWVPQSCAAWVWQREVVEPAAYVTLWLRDANETPGSERYRRQYDRWLDWFDEVGAVAVGMGLMTLWHSGSHDPMAGMIVCEDVPQPVEQPSGAAIAAWYRRARWLATTSDRELLDHPLRGVAGLVLSHDDVAGAGGWQTTLRRLRQSHGMRWEVEVDAEFATLLGAFAQPTPPGVALAVLAASVGEPAEQVVGAALPVLRDLVRRGFLVPVSRHGGMYE
jgi:hypothetical protein